MRGERLDGETEREGSRSAHEKDAPRETDTQRLDGTFVVMLWQCWGSTLSEVLSPSDLSCCSSSLYTIDATTFNLLPLTQGTEMSRIPSSSLFELHLRCRRETRERDGVACPKEG
jgi:hypothetical protein